MSVEIITHAPNLMMGTSAASAFRVFTVDATAMGLDIHRHRALERRVRRLCMCAERWLVRWSPPFSRSPWVACEAVCLDNAAWMRRGGMALRMDARLPVSVGPLHATQIKFWGIQLVLRRSSNSTHDQLGVYRAGFNRTLKEQIPLHGLRIYPCQRHRREHAERQYCIGFVEQLQLPSGIVPESERRT